MKMRTVFMMLMDMSVSSCPLILAVILLRMLLRRSPKNISLVLWAIVGLRLICPLSVESVLSLSLPTNAVSDT
ncbi:MAG: transcriptional regulator, partial [Alphaproteobacteria bacterium]|nr:transcriptional regulator [Alphaproteobacteria bacterium]